jgi:putative restriction endonuclease
MNEKTFSDAIEEVMLHNGYYAPLQVIYKEFEKYRKKTGLTPDKTIQERVQRDSRFTRI